MLPVPHDLGKVMFDALIPMLDGANIMDFIRYVGWESALPIGQLIDGGNFIHLGAGIIHGWDPSITESIF